MATLLLIRRAMLTRRGFIVQAGFPLRIRESQSFQAHVWGLYNTPL